MPDTLTIALALAVLGIAGAALVAYLQWADG
jgi:hypothetical protein